MNLFSNISDKFRQLSKIKLYNPLSLSSGSNKPVASFTIWITSFVSLVLTVILIALNAQWVFLFIGAAVIVYYYFKVIRFIFTGKN